MRMAKFKSDKECSKPAEKTVRAHDDAKLLDLHKKRFAEFKHKHQQENKEEQIVTQKVIGQKKESSSLEILIIKQFNGGVEDDDLMKFFDQDIDFQCFVVERYLIGRS